VGDREEKSVKVALTRQSSHIGTEAASSCTGVKKKKGRIIGSPRASSGGNCRVGDQKSISGKSLSPGDGEVDGIWGGWREVVLKVVRAVRGEKSQGRIDE